MNRSARSVSVVLCLGAVALLAACGKGGGGGATPSLAGPDWNEADACKTLDKTAVQAATGQAVTSAEVSTTSAKSEGLAAVSTCTYTLASGTVVLMTRVSQEDLTDDEIAQMQTGGGMLPAGEEVSGLGMKAYYTAETRQFQLFADRKHYAGVVYAPAMTLPGAPAPATALDPKAVTTALAKALL